MAPSPWFIVCGSSKGILIRHPLEVAEKPSLYKQASDRGEEKPGKPHHAEVISISCSGWRRRWRDSLVTSLPTAMHFYSAWPAMLLGSVSCVNANDEGLPQIMNSSSSPPTTPC